MTKAKTTPVKLEGNELVLHTTFDQFKAELEQQEKTYLDAEFDMTTKKGLKEAKSYVYQMKRSKAPITDAHKEAKATALELCNALDGAKKEYIDRIQVMIDYHETKVKDYEAIETNRIADIKSRMSEIKGFIDNESFISGIQSEDASEWLKNVEAIEIDETFGEFQDEAQEIKDETITKLKTIRENAIQHEQEKAELEELRKKTLEQEKELEKQRIEQQAKEKAEREVQERIDKAEREKDAAEQAKKDTEARVAKDREEAAAEAERQKQIAVENERQRAEEKERARLLDEEVQRKEQLRLEEIEAERVANEEHRANIHSNISKSLLNAGVAEPMADWFVQVLQTGAIPHVQIQY